MKKNLLLLLSALFMVILPGSCKKDNAAQTGTSLDTSVITSGVWNIASFTQKTENKTSDYAGMDFTFNNDGSLKVTGTETANGAWSYAASAPGYYGAPATSSSFTINIAANSRFSKLSRTWNVGTNTATSLQLDHPEPLEDEHVVFTKK